LILVDIDTGHFKENLTGGAAVGQINGVVWEGAP